MELNNVKCHKDSRTRPWFSIQKIPKKLPQGLPLRCLQILGIVGTIRVLEVEIENGSQDLPFRVDKSWNYL